MQNLIIGAGLAAIIAFLTIFGFYDHRESDWQEARAARFECLESGLGAECNFQEVKTMYLVKYNNESKKFKKLLYAKRFKNLMEHYGILCKIYKN